MSNLQLFAVTDQGPHELSVRETATSFEELYQGLALGVYSAFRTFNHNSFLYLQEHLTRTVQSMRNLGWRYQLNQERLRRMLDEVCTSFPAENMRVRIDVLASPASQLDTESRELIALMPLTPLAKELYTNGVTARVAQGISRHDPLTKSASFAEERKQYVRTAPKAHEYLLLDQNAGILEGFSSNFYAVQKGTIYTADEGVLEGITRRIILQLAQQEGIPVRYQPPPMGNIDEFEEAAISSSSRGWLPVVQIDETVVGTGKPGQVSLKMMKAYGDFVQREIRRAI